MVEACDHIGWNVTVPHKEAAARLVDELPTGAGWTLYPPQAILSGTPGQDWGIILMLASLGFLDFVGPVQTALRRAFGESLRLPEIRSTSPYCRSAIAASLLARQGIDVLLLALDAG